MLISRVRAVSIAIAVGTAGCGGGCEYKDELPKLEGFAQVCALDGDWIGVEPQPQPGKAYVLGRSGRVASVDPSGTLRDVFQAGEGFSAIRTAKLTPAASPSILIYGSWGTVVSAHDAAGKPQWTYATNEGINEVAAGDLTADGRDEVIVGLNGDGGVLALDPDGKLLWTNQSIGNVWHVATGRPLAEDAGLQVLTTAADGEVHTFDRQGRSLGAARAQCYATFVDSMVDAAGSENFIVGGSTENYELMIATWDIRGWHSTVGGARTSLESASQWQGQNWLAVGIVPGVVRVVEIVRGGVVATATGQGKRPSVAWLADGKSAPLLLVATGKQLRAFRVTNKNPA